MNFDQLIAKARTLDTKAVTGKAKEVGLNLTYPLAAVIAYHVFEGDLGMDTLTQPIEWLLELLKDSPTDVA